MPQLYRLLAALVAIHVIGLATAGQVLAQAVPGDDCAFAIDLGEVSRYCSPREGFTTVGTAPARFSIEGTCASDTLFYDLYFAFVATATDANIRVLGQLERNSGGTLTRPQFQLLPATCAADAEVLACASDGFGAGVAETFVSELVPGVTYLLRVSGEGQGQGSFQLCIDQFDYVPEPKGDCVDAVILCEKKSFTIANLLGTGNDKNEVTESCIREEFASVWYKWTCEEAGTLEFTLDLNNPSDDLDFVVYELPGGIDDCANKQAIRCMASGENRGDPFPIWEPCTGATGLRSGDGDFTEDAGCTEGDNNFVEAITMESGKSYALIVNNFSRTGNGFAISWGGTGTFRGPRAAFAADPAFGSQCDLDPVTFTNQSTTTPGGTNSYAWFFGEFANPTRSFVAAPDPVEYFGSGDKTIVLRVTGDEGCVVTARQEITIEPCCDASEPLVAGRAVLSQPSCPGTPSGGFSVPIEQGVPVFSYSVEGGRFLSDSTVSGLFAGDYTMFVRNIKGCLDTVDASLIDPEPISVDAGEDRSAVFGAPVRLRATSQGVVDGQFQWSGVDSVICLDPPLCSEVDAFVYSPSEVTATVINAAGCAASDRLEIDVQITRPLYAPTAFSPNGDGVNARWTLYGPEGIVVRLTKLMVFDRWGNMTFQATDIPASSPDNGWDGNLNGEPCPTAVYAFYAEVKYIDGEVVPVSGSLNLLR